VREENLSTKVHTEAQAHFQVAEIQVSKVSSNVNKVYSSAGVNYY